ncbi:choline dehydrogenase [Xylariomycetidae sp. FL0641]|nr:choline dehydrogenase [Xylariomycetidae sp. FL0641]
MPKLPSVADYVGVGGGLTRCTVASRLSQSNKKPTVILLEAGSDPSHHPAVAGFLSGLSLQRGEFDYAYQSEPVATTYGRIHTLNSGKALGGGSILNYGGWLRADAADYNEWAEAVGDQRWSYEGMKPWFRKSEAFHDNSGDISEHGFDGRMHVTSVSASDPGQRKYPLREPVKQAWLELGVPPNPEKKNGTINGLTEILENSRKGKRQPSYSAYPLDQVQVFPNRPVRRLTIDKNKTADGVELADGRKITARKEVIVCAGVYCTPQILMLSGIGPKKTLETHGIPLVHELPHVGQNLHDHSVIYLAYRLRNPSLGGTEGSTTCLPWDWVANESLPAEILRKHGLQAEEQARTHYEVMTMYVSPGLAGIPLGGPHIATSTMLFRPTSRGAVSIRSNNPSDPPAIQPNLFATSLDLDTIIHATRRTVKALTATASMRDLVECEECPQGEGFEGLATLTPDSDDATIKERVRRTGTQHFHSGGTAAMGKVVDSEGRVLGVKGLRVADASIIPIPLSGHPQATLYAMAEQLASMVTKDDE